MIFGAIGSDVIAARARCGPSRTTSSTSTASRCKKGSEKLRYSYTATIRRRTSRWSSPTSRSSASRGQRRSACCGATARTSSPAATRSRSTSQRGGGKIVADLPVQKSQGSYTQEIIELQQRGGRGRLHPRRRAVADQHHEAGQDPAVQPELAACSPSTSRPRRSATTRCTRRSRGANLAPAYECHTLRRAVSRRTPTEIREFEAAYAKYSPNTDLCGLAGDIAWGVARLQGHGRAVRGVRPRLHPQPLRRGDGGRLQGATIGGGCAVDFSRRRPPRRLRRRL